MMFITKLAHRSLRNRRFYSCDQKPNFDESKNNFVAINNNLDVINYNVKICFYFSLINIFASVFC